MLHTKKTFSVPATTPTKTPCAIHHIVKGKCLRCDHKVVQTYSKAETMPTDSEGAE
jgi:hypothetical protein